MLRDAHVELGGVHLGQPDLGPDSRSLALTLHGERAALHLMCNAWWEPLDFEVPPLQAGERQWRRILDTTLQHPDDLVAYPAATPVSSGCHVGPRSVVCLATPRDVGPGRSTGRHAVSASASSKVGWASTPPTPRVEADPQATASSRASSSGQPLA